MKKVRTSIWEQKDVNGYGKVAGIAGIVSAIAVLTQAALFGIGPNTSFILGLINLFALAATFIAPVVTIIFLVLTILHLGVNKGIERQGEKKKKLKELRFENRRMQKELEDSRSR